MLYFVDRVAGGSSVVQTGTDFQAGRP